jgi:hypothetical protein
MLDFAVNVRADARPARLTDRRRARMGDLGRYPLPAGGAEGFALLPNHLLFSVGDAELVRKRLDAQGIAVRRCDTIVEAMR